jgi:hypothetical protein
MGATVVETSRRDQGGPNGSSSPDFSQADGVLNGYCQTPKPDQALTGSLRLDHGIQCVAATCARIVPARLGNALNGLPIYRARDAARGWW